MSEDAATGIVSDAGSVIDDALAKLEEHASNKPMAAGWKT